MSKKNVADLSCTDCSVYNCKTRDREFPSFCLTTKDNEEHSIAKDIEEIKQHLKGDDRDAVMARASTQVEGLFYGKLTRVEEIMEFANRIGANRIGIATCAGLIEESVGLCVGHDSLFVKYSEAPVTTLITKDRVTGHNPVSALYTAHSYYKRLFVEKK